MRVKCDDCPCYNSGEPAGGFFEGCNLGADTDYGVVGINGVHSDNCPLIEVRYWKDSEVARFTPETCVNPPDPRER
jgi:hypothetical protein